MPVLRKSLKKIQGGLPGSLFIFYALVLYVFLQFCWWFYLLFDLNIQIYQLKEELAASTGGSGLDKLPELRKKQFMIFGEGMVFLILLMLGMLQTRRSFRRETEAARQQKNFLLSVTHELKSPVASVKLILETIGKRGITPEKQSIIVSRAIEETDRLDHLIENILVTARIDNHVYALHKERLDLSSLLERFAVRFNTARHREILHLNNIADIYISADALAIESILNNLVENAVKYSDQDSVVQIDLRRDNHYAVICVSDSGTGIADADKGKVFGKFFRSGNEETRRTKGTGLGLYIVKYLIEKHNGIISLRDNQPRGSIFEIRFKLAS